MDGHKKGRAFGRFGERWRRVLREDDVWARARICSGGTPPTLRRVGGRSVGLGRCIPWPRPTGTVAEAWSVCSYAPSAGHTNTCEPAKRVVRARLAPVEPKESLLLPSCSFSLERRSGTWPLSIESETNTWCPAPSSARRARLLEPSHSRRVGNWIVLLPHGVGNRIPSFPGRKSRARTKEGSGSAAYV